MEIAQKLQKEKNQSKLINSLLIKYFKKKKNETTKDILA